MKFQFATAARDFRLIDDKGAQCILVEYREGADLIKLLKRKGPETWLMRKLQRYAVSVNARDFEDIRKAWTSLKKYMDAGYKLMKSFTTLKPG